MVAKKAARKDKLAYDEKLMARHIAELLTAGFYWIDTTEGYAYWAGVVQRLIRMAKS